MNLDTEGKYAALRISTPVEAGHQGAVLHVHLRVVTGVLGEGEEVLGRSVETQTVDISFLGPLLGEGVSQGYVFETEERTILDEAGVKLILDISLCRGYEVRCVGGRPAVGDFGKLVGAFVLRLGIEHTVGVVDVVAVLELNHERKVEALEAEGVGDTAVPVGQTVADDGTVIGGDDSVAVDVAVLDHTGLDSAACVRRDVGNTGLQHTAAVGLEVEVGVLVDAVEDIAEHLAKRRTDVSDIVVVAEVRVEGGCRLDIAGTVLETLEGVLDEGDVEVGGPAEVAVLDIDAVDVDFKTAVSDFADILPLRTETGDVCEFLGKEKVLGILDEEVGGNVEAVVEETEVETNVGSCGAFPFQVLVGELLGVENGDELLAEAELAVGIKVHREVVGDAVVTYLAPAGAELEIREDGLIFHEVFVRDTPCSGERGEVAPLVGLGEYSRTVGTDGRGEEVAAVVVVVRTGEEREQTLFGARGVHGAGGGAHAEVVVLKVGEGEILGLAVEELSAAESVFVTEHDVEVVLAELALPGKRVADLPAEFLSHLR